jgi:PAS domain S-box-containing protein
MSVVVSKRRTALDALSGASRFQLLVEAVNDYAIYLLDPDGYVASWNAGAERFKGYSADEIIGQHFSRFYTEEDRATGLPKRALETALREGKFEGEGWRVRKDGTRFWTSVVIDPVISPSGELIGYAKVTRDITDKLATRQALFESEQRFRILVQGVRDCAIYLLDKDGVVSDWNSGAEAIKGYSAQEIIGQHFSRFYTPEDRANGEPERALQTALATGKYETEAQRVRKDGSRFWASVLIDPLFDETGELIGFAKVTRDISERRRAEEEIETAREALHQAQKMEAVGRLTGGVAHDFNNLLTIIRSSIDLLTRPDLSEERRDRYLNAISETTDRAALLTGQLLAFARRQPLRPEPFDVARRLEGLEQIICASLGSPVELQIDVPDGLGAVEADPNQFETAVLNIIINARDAMPQGGKVRISAEAPKSAPGLDPRLSYVSLSIEDNGTGMDEATRVRIFEPFFTTKEVNKGTGLGLSQVYGFVKQSGGDIQVDSTLGKGTAFTIYLPRATERITAGADPLPPTGLPEKLSTARVLLVEDNEKVGEFASGLLSELGQTVTWSRNASNALELLSKHRDEFDIVFSDIVMPGTNGVQMAKEIRRRWPDLPVILTSGYSHALVEQGSQGFELIQKPYSMDALLKALSRHRPCESGEMAPDSNLG